MIYLVPILSFHKIVCKLLRTFYGFNLQFDCHLNNRDIDIGYAVVSIRASLAANLSLTILYRINLFSAELGTFNKNHIIGYKTRKLIKKPGNKTRLHEYEMANIFVGLSYLNNKIKKGNIEVTKLLKII